MVNKEVFLLQYNFDRYYNKDVDKAPHSIEPTVSAKSVFSLNLSRM